MSNLKKEHIMKSLPIMSPIQRTSHKYGNTDGALLVTYITEKDTHMNEKEKYHMYCTAQS